MKNTQTIPWIITIICIGAYFYQQNYIEILKENLLITNQARKIDADQIRDLLFANQQLCAENESIATRSYVSGVVSVINNKEHFEEIWHDGYDRGTEVQMLAYQAKLNQNELNSKSEVKKLHEQWSSNDNEAKND